MNTNNTIDTTNPSGFTLIEILIAIFIFSVVITTIYTSYTGTFRVINGAESQAETYRMARIAMERMIEDLESVYIAKSNGDSHQQEATNRSFQFVGEQRELKARRADSLLFISRVYINLSGQDQDYGATQIRYYVKENENGDDFILYRDDRPVFEESFSPEEESKGLVLCEGLKSVAFSYQGEDGKVFESWDSESDALKGKIPTMVSISLEFENGSNPEKPLRFMTSVALPMELGYL